MNLKTFLLKKEQKPTPWAKENNLEPVIILRFLQGKRGLSAQTMSKIVAATGGEVTYEDLVAEMTERRADRRAADKPDNGGESVEITPVI